MKSLNFNLIKDRLVKQPIPSTLTVPVLRISIRQMKTGRDTNTNDTNKNNLLPQPF
jgi:hypothetical protein